MINEGGSGGSRLRAQGGSRLRAHFHGVGFGGDHEAQ